jgi:hypothetical protein
LLNRYAAAGVDPEQVLDHSVTAALADASHEPVTTSRNGYLPADEVGRESRQSTILSIRLHSIDIGLV